MKIVHLRAGVFVLTESEVSLNNQLLVKAEEEIQQKVEKFWRKMTFLKVQAKKEHPQHETLLARPSFWWKRYYSPNG